MGRHRSPVWAKPTRADRKQLAGRSLLAVVGVVLTVLVLRAAWTSAVHTLTVTVLVASAGYVVGAVLCRRTGETTISHILCGALSLGVLMFTPGSALLAGYGEPFLVHRMYSRHR